MQHRAYDLCLCLFRSLKMSWTVLQSFIALRQRGGQGWVYLYPLSLLPIFWGVPHWMGGLRLQRLLCIKNCSSAHLDCKERSFVVFLSPQRSMAFLLWLLTLTNHFLPDNIIFGPFSVNPRHFPACAGKSLEISTLCSTHTNLSGSKNHATCTEVT